MLGLLSTASSVLGGSSPLSGGGQSDGGASSSATGTFTSGAMNKETSSTWLIAAAIGVGLVIALGGRKR